MLKQFLVLVLVSVATSQPLLHLEPVNGNLPAGAQIILLAPGGLAAQAPAPAAPLTLVQAPAPVLRAAPAPVTLVRAAAPVVATAEDDQSPAPYSFAFDSVDEFGTKLTRSESADESGTITGSYSYLDANGLTRVVNYVADDNGFRASVDTNEPGTITSNPADVEIRSSAQ